MKKNMGSIDKIIRLIVVLILAGLYFTKVIEGTLGLIAIAISVVFLLTSLISFCPLYTILGINTCKKK